MLLYLLLALPDLPEEDRLLEQARAGDRRAIATIYEQYVDAVYSFIRWRVHEPALAEDLTSEVFIKLLSALHSPNAPRQTLRGWLFRVARNVLHDHYKQPDLSAELDEWVAAPDDTEGDLLAMLDVERVRQAISTLPPDQQDVLIMRFGQVMSLQDTAESMGRSVSAIKSLQFRAVDALRRAMQDRWTSLEAEHGTY